MKITLHAPLRANVVPGYREALMIQIDPTSPPDYAAMSDRTFNEAVMEFLDLCAASHPHWNLWIAEQTRRIEASRAARIAALRHLSPSYVDLTKAA